MSMRIAGGFVTPIGRCKSTSAGAVQKITGTVSTDNGPEMWHCTFVSCQGGVQKSSFLLQCGSPVQYI